MNSRTQNLKITLSFIKEFKELKNDRNEHFIELQENNKHVTDIQEN